MENKNRGWKRALLIIIPHFITTLLFQLSGMWLFGMDLHDTTSQENLVVLSFFNLLGTVAIILVFMKWVDKAPFVQLGLETKQRLPEILCGLGLGALAVGAGYLLLLAKKEIVVDTIHFDAQGFFMSIVLFSTVAVAEEFISRGYILRNLMLSFNRYLALLLSALLFLLPHSFNPHLSALGLSSIFFAGILLGATYIFTKNLWFAIVLHLSWNLAQSLLGFNVSGQDFYSLVEYHIPQENIWNGGDFGFEGSLLSIFAEFTLIGVIYVVCAKKACFAIGKKRNARLILPIGK